MEHATYVKERRTGHSRTDGISDFNQGEGLYFSLKSNKLQMHRVRNNKTFVIDNIGTDGARHFYFHISLFDDGTTLTLEPLDAQERAVFD